jgi:hypothetical protein
MLPLLLAAMLVVIFGPLHRWLRDRMHRSPRGLEWIPPSITTLFVLLIVLVPLFLLVRPCGRETPYGMLRSPDGLEARAGRARQDSSSGINDTTGMHLTADSVNGGTAADLAEEWIGPVAARTPVVIAKG